MLILGIESSCDETAASVARDHTEILSNVVSSQVEEHKLYGGVVPEIASRRHCENVLPVVQKALDDAGVTLAELDGIAVTAYPGLIGALLVGVNFAKGLALTAGKPLVPVHHLAGHIASNYIAHPELKPPYLCLVVSGGHSHLVEVLSYTTFRILGRTRDDAAGECFDKCARAMGYPYPGGIHLDKASKNGNPDAFSLPRPKIAGNAYDFSFSGLKTAVVNLLHNTAQKGGTICKVILPHRCRRPSPESSRSTPCVPPENTAIPPLPLPAASPLTAAFVPQCRRRAISGATGFTCRPCICAATTAQ